MSKAWPQRTNLWRRRTSPGTPLERLRGRSVHLEGTMRPRPEHLLPAPAAIFIMGCLFVFLSALWAFVITKAMIGIGAMALFIAGACAYAHRHALKPLKPSTLWPSVANGFQEQMFGVNEQIP